MTTLWKSAMLVTVWTMVAVGSFANGDSCTECTYCVTYQQANFSGTYLGNTVQGTNNPFVEQAYNGTGNGGSTAYAVNGGCEDASALDVSPVVGLTVWTFTSITPSCTIDSPPKQYKQPASGGVGQTALSFINQRACSISE